MKLRNILLLKKVKIFAVIILGLIIIDGILRLFVFDSDPIISLLSYADNFYLLLTEKFADLLLSWTGSPVSIENHIAMLNNIQLSGFFPMTLYKKWTIFLICLFWLTKTSFGRKFIFTGLLIIVNYFLVSVDIALKAHLASFEFPNHSIMAISMTFGTMSMATILFIWYWKHRESILNSLSMLRINTELLRNKLPAIILIIYFSLIVMHFVMDYFDFGLWINFLFTSSQKILALLGYNSTVEPFLLVGDNGSIYMAKACLGYNTMFLFASVVYLTGNSNKSRWIYIIIGILILSFANIIRFVLLFIHIQKHGDYILAMDFHNIYNYCIYTVVFILWVIWFEKFADKAARKKPIDPVSIN